MKEDTLAKPEDSEAPNGEQVAPDATCPASFTPGPWISEPNNRPQDGRVCDCEDAPCCGHYEL